MGQTGSWRVAVAVLAIVCAWAIGVSAATWYVDASVAASGDGTSWVTAFKTIGEAITAATNGDTIEVAAGEYRFDPYNEHTKAGVAITKSVTLLGPNAGTPGYAGRVAEAVIYIEGPDTGWAGVHGLAIGAPNVMIDGFKVAGQAWKWGFSPVEGADRLTVQNNIIETGMTLFFSIDDFTYRHNLVQNTDSVPPLYDRVQHNAIYAELYGGSLSGINWIITDNRITEVRSALVLSSAGCTYNRIVFSRNEVIEPLVMGVNLGGGIIVGNLAVSDNSITDAGNSGVYFAPSLLISAGAAIAIESNEISATVHGVFLACAAAGGGAEAVVEANTIRDGSVAVRVYTAAVAGIVDRIKYNNFVGNTWGVYNDTTVGIDARCNWWNDPCGPGTTHGPLWNGLPTSGDGVNANVDYTPWSPFFDPQDTNCVACCVTITVTKTLVGAAPGSDWEFTGTGPIGPFTLPAGGGGPTAFLVPAGTTYTITETTKPGYTVTYSIGGAPPQAGFSVSVEAKCGSDVQIEFINTEVGAGGGGGGGGGPAQPSPITISPGLPGVGTTVCGCWPVICIQLSVRQPYEINPASIVVRIEDREYKVGDRGVSWDGRFVCVDSSRTEFAIPLGRVRVYVRAGVLDPETGEPVPDRDSFGMWFFECGLCVPDTSRFPAGWNMISTPLASSLTFTGIPSPVLWWWNAAAGKYEGVTDPTALSPVHGYWMRVPEGGTTARAFGDEVTTDVTLNLGVRGWHMVSNPWCYMLDAVRVTRGQEALSWSGAVAAGWVGDALWIYDPVVGAYAKVKWMDPWLGYWMRAKVDGVSLTFLHAEQGVTRTAGLMMMSLALPGDPVPPPVPQARDLQVFVQMGNFPNPVTDVHTTTFRVWGPMATLVTDIKVRVFDLSGKMVWQGGAAGAELTWHTDDLAGRYLANGVYVYQITAQVAGTTVSSGLLKLSILR